MVNFSRFVALCLACLMVPSLVLAQTAPSEEQIALVLKGVAAADANDFDEADRLYRAALILGDLNIAHMGLGRVLQKRGQCFEAEESYQSALSATIAVEEPSQDQVKAAIEGFRAEFGGDCGGRIIIQCATPDTLVVVDGLAQKCGATLNVASGEHTVVATLEKETQTETLKVAGMATVTAQITLVPPVDIGPGPDPDPVPVETSSVAGWVWIGTGAALLAGGGVAGALLFGANEDVGEAIDARDVDLGEDAEQRALISEIGMWAGLGSGAAALIIGIVLLADDESPPADQSFWLAPLPDGRGAGAGFKTRF